MSETALQTEKPEVAPEQSPTSPRKRRRRAPTTGAADDCFACQERQTKCDRRRPYCTQCLDQGKDCSGYKTTLTWGVGVASRGKLRGLSLPIAKSKKVAADSDVKTEGKKRSASAQLTKLGPTRNESQQPTVQTAFEAPDPEAGSGGTRTTTFNFVNIDPASTASPMLPPPSLDWRTPTSQARANLPRPTPKRARRHSLQPLHVPALHSFRDLGGVPMTANNLGGYGDHDYEFSVQCSPITPMFTGYGPTSPPYKELQPQHPLVQSPCEGDLMGGHESIGWHRDSMASSLCSDPSSRDYGEDETFFADPIVANTLDDLLSNQQALQHQPHAIQLVAEPTMISADGKLPSHSQQSMDLVPDDCGAHPSLSLSRQLPSQPIGKTPEMRFLIEYFERVISPVIVAFDSPTNPYRSHILRLAVESETLQHAIAALSASNLRLRRGHNPLNHSRQSISDSRYGLSVRKSSIAHSIMDAGRDHVSQTPANEPSVEELYHKTASIRALNQQLADPKRRTDDSILATLLILCLYHICDTGVAKFKTQFAGVKKILAMRGGTSGLNSKATNWLTIMFTWFDAMTATVNDREGQLEGDEVDWTVLNGDKWALENLAGCDGKLFKTIAKLGRLNLLSQCKPVGDHPSRSSPGRHQPVAAGPRTQDYYSMSYNQFDGNGWARLLNEDELHIEAPDSRTQFWKEWAEVRKKLQEWQLDASSLESLDSAASPGDRVDLSHISESFRYSALLYTERLAYPHLPSMHSNFQSLVTQALYHISNVKSDVFLLWPLFITGTECVDEESRRLIRQRCLDIQKDSGFFNNISGLELLEQVWQDDTSNDFGLGLETGMGAQERASVGGEGFKWRKAMERVDGEYIVV
ncbi:MAG: hypothetical protein LQ342_004384 [Letrouitia transgressa]|nr:MAG: hypothetical protein LQ342_004384 [Letrouitia transgressa]